MFSRLPLRSRGPAAAGSRARILSLRKVAYDSFGRLSRLLQAAAIECKRQDGEHACMLAAAQQPPLTGWHIKGGWRSSD